MSARDGGTAFPIASDVIGHADGMSLRAYLAAEAIDVAWEQERAEGARWADNETEASAAVTPAMIARRAVRIADAIIAELGRA